MIMDIQLKLMGIISGEATLLVSALPPFSALTEKLAFFPFMSLPLFGRVLPSREANKQGSQKVAPLCENDG